MFNSPQFIPASNFAMGNKRVFLDFEKPLQDIYEEIKETEEELSKASSPTEKAKLKRRLNSLKRKYETTAKEINASLTPWLRVQLSRHPNRPQFLDYVSTIFQDFFELHGDRGGFDDPSMVTGIAKLESYTVVLIGQQKGKTTKERQYRNFGMNNPEGYRKALRAMKLAERFSFPVITFIDTPGAFPGIEAEERGQAYAIARNLYEMSRLRTPIICVIIGEGASGGALGIGVGDILLMMENTWFAVISPESCSSILWRSWDFKEKAAEILRLTAQDLYKYGIVDEIVPEPAGGAHHDPEGAAQILRGTLIKHLKSLLKLPQEELLRRRWLKYRRFGAYMEDSTLYTSFPIDNVPELKREYGTRTNGSAGTK